MNQELVGAKLQTLLDNLVRKDKSIYNATLGVATEEPNFTWAGAAGTADAAGGTAMQPETPYFLASITKMYTAVAVMILQERGRLDLGDRLAKYLPASLIQGIHRLKGTDYTDQITLRQLLSHSSGLADYSLERPRQGKPFHLCLFTEGDRSFTVDDVMRLVRDELTPYFPPSATKAHYSDTNYQLLGAVIEAATGGRLHDLFAELFFLPRGMTQTYLSGYPRMAAPAEPAKIYFRDRALNIPQAMKSIGAQGGMVSTSQDSLRFLQALTRGEVFARRETFAAMQQWNKIFFPLEYGLGLMRFKMPRWMSPFMPAPELVGHSGSTGSFLYYSAERKLYIAGTVNQVERQRAPFQIMLQVAEILRKAR